MKQTFIATAVDKDAAKVEAFRGQAVCFGLPFDVETGTRVAITFETIDQTVGGMDDAEPGPGRWAKLYEEAKAKQAAETKPKPRPDYYYYVGKKIKHLPPEERVGMYFIVGKRPCWPIRALQALVGIHWAEEGKIIGQIQTNKK